MSRNYELLREDLDLHQQDFPAPPRAYAQDTRSAAGKRTSGLDQIARQESLKLVERIFLRPSSETPRLVVFAGIDRGSGCSRVSADASEVLAGHVHGNVCLVDANLQSSSLPRHFGISNDHGLTDALDRPGLVRDFTCALDKRLWLLPSGVASRDGFSLLDLDRIGALLAELRKEFEFILVDAPPLNHHAESAMLGRLSDGLVVILEANSTRREAALRVTRSLQENQVNILGVVLNRRTFPIPESIYRKL